MSFARREGTLERAPALSACDKSKREPCALCDAESSYFVTRQVRLCEGCVALLSTGAMRLPDAG